jgi:rod shape-determining protein MreD
MWKKILSIIILFYFFTLLQNSFFIHFNLFGSVPNIVFSFFFLLTFFEKKESDYYIFFLAILAGFLTDVFSYTYMGISVVLFSIIGILIKKIQLLLTSREDDFPFFYFLPLFILFLSVYNLLKYVCVQYLNFNRITMVYGPKIIISIIYSSMVASLFFYIYKWFMSKANKYS